MFTIYILYDILSPAEKSDNLFLIYDVSYTTWYLELFILSLHQLISFFIIQLSFQWV